MMPRSSTSWKPTHTPEEDARIRELYEDYEYGIHPIARSIERSPWFVSKRLRAMGVQVRPQGGRPGACSLDHNEMILPAKLYERGYSAPEIARVMDLHYRTIVVRLHKAGVPMRSRSEALKLRWARQRSGEYVSERRKRTKPRPPLKRRVQDSNLDLGLMRPAA